MRSYLETLKSLGYPARIAGFAVLSIHVEYKDEKFKASFDPTATLCAAFNGIHDIVIAMRGEQRLMGKAYQDIQDVSCEEKHSVLVHIVASDHDVITIREDGLRRTLLDWLFLDKVVAMLGKDNVEKARKVLMDVETSCTEFVKAASETIEPFKEYLALKRFGSDIDPITDDRVFFLLAAKTGSAKEALELIKLECARADRVGNMLDETSKFVLEQIYREQLRYVGNVLKKDGVIQRSGLGHLTAENAIDRLLANKYISFDPEEYAVSLTKEGKNAIQRSIKL